MQKGRDAAAQWAAEKRGMGVDVVFSDEKCHDPSHGGSYMAEGAFYIRIGLPPRVVSGDCLASSRLRTDFSLPSLLPRASDVS